MKLKRSLLLFGLLLVPCFSNAVNVVNDLGDYEDLGGNNNCTINDDYSFNCSESNNVIIGTDSSWYKTSSSYFRTPSGLATYYYSQNSSGVQGYVSALLYCGENSNPLLSCNSKHNITYEEFSSYISSHNLKSWMWYSSASTPGYAGPAFIFDNSYILIAPSAGTSFFGMITPYDFGLVGYGLESNWSQIALNDSPFVKYYVSSDCPSVGQLKRGYGLNPNVCYAGFDSTDLYGDSSVFRGGQGMDIFSVYNLYSGGTYLQSRYDTFWGYYQSLSQSQENNFIFSGGNIYSPGTASKALLGLQFARQNFGNGKTSYQILNYCYYVVNNISDNTSSCVANNVVNTYPNVEMSSSDYQNIIDDLYTDYDVHISGEGSPFYMSGDNFGTFGQLFSGFFSLFNSSMTKTDFSGVGDGILPYYIGLAFIIVVLYGILTR